MWDGVIEWLTSSDVPLRVSSNSVILSSFSRASLRAEDNSTFQK